MPEEGGQPQRHSEAGEGCRADVEGPERKAQQRQAARLAGLRRSRRWRRRGDRRGGLFLAHEFEDCVAQHGQIHTPEIIRCRMHAC